MLNDEVNHGKVQRENENRDHNHRGRGPNFLPRWRGYFAHFAAHVVVERLDALRPGLHRSHECVFGHGGHLILLSSCSVCACAARSSSKILAGAEGFEPPSSVLETDSLTVELTPLEAGVRDQGLGVSYLALPTVFDSLSA